MKIHREGFVSIAVAAVLFCIINIAGFSFFFETYPVTVFMVLGTSFGLLLFIMSFFRVPNRIYTYGDMQIISPADGKVVVIEEVYDEEYFKDKRLQLSVFMSPANVHVNRHPANGEVVYNKYHKGKYLVAWHPKSSTENERWSLVTKTPFGEILYKQIAGALAKRIVNYSKVGEKAKQCSEYGFIKFGSRVDLLLPLGTKVNVSLNEVVKGGVTILAEFTPPGK